MLIDFFCKPIEKLIVFDYREALSGLGVDTTWILTMINYSHNIGALFLSEYVPHFCNFCVDSNEENFEHKPIKWQILFTPKWSQLNVFLPSERISFFSRLTKCSSLTLIDLPCFAFICHSFRCLMTSLYQSEIQGFFENYKWAYATLSYVSSYRTHLRTLHIFVLKKLSVYLWSLSIIIFLFRSTCSSVSLCRRKTYSKLCEKTVYINFIYNW